MALSDLMTTPAGFAEATELIDRLDECFLMGFSRLGQDQSDDLASLQKTFTGTPLEARLGEAVEALGSAQFLDKHFIALAAARSALQGAQYDALAAQAAAALGRTRRDVVADQAVETPAPVATWMDSTRQWLVEVALTGFLQLELETIMPFSATMEQLQQEPRAVRLAMLLTGFTGELLAAMPMAARTSVTRRRWVDLWCRAMLSSLALPAQPTSQLVSGTFSPIGMDLKHHPNAVSATIYGALDVGAGEQAARITLSAYKVDVITEEEVWQLFSPAAQTVLDCHATGKAIALKNVKLLASGDLVLSGKVSAGKPFDRLALAEKVYGAAAATPEVAPADRHPVQLAIPVFLSDVEGKVDKKDVVFATGDAELAFAASQTSHASILHPADTKARDAVLTGKGLKIFGLLRWDAGKWALEPMAIDRGGENGLAFTGHDAAMSNKSYDTLSILKERSGRLLRKKS
jgi:hypothetical protein